MKNFFAIKTTKILVAFTAPILLASCGKQLHIKSSTFADVRTIPQGFPIGSAFSITPIDNDNHLLSKELANKIATVLTDKGYRVTKTPSADYHLEFSYQMKSATRTVTLPKYVSGPVQTTQGVVYGHEGAVQYQEQTQSAGQIIYVTEEQTYFITTLTLEVYDAKEDKELWEGSATTSTDSSDMRDTLDYLLVTAFKHFGKNTQKELSAMVSYKNKEVDLLRKEYFTGL